MPKAKILIQLDSDAHASAFDAVVAVDAGIDRLLQYGGVEPQRVRELVHGAIFTRGPKDLNATAIFIGGSDVARGEQLLEQVQAAFFGPMRVSVLLDASGANTTAAAAVLAAARHVPLRGALATVLAATGPVGQRSARLLAGQGARVRVASRSQARAAAVCEAIRARQPQAQVEPWRTGSPDETLDACRSAKVLIAAGAAGVTLLPDGMLAQCDELQVAIDLNAVPPQGIADIEITDAAVQRDQLTTYGAVGVGGTKMKIHKAALAALFQRNDQVLDAEQILEIGQQLAGGG